MSCVTGLQNITVRMSVWNLPASTGFLFLNILEQHNLWVTLSHPKYTKPMKGNKTDRKDAKWICDLYMCGMVKPSFIPPADIRELRDLVRYRYKLTCMITGEKNRAQNCLTVSNLKLDDVFSDVFGKSSRSITEQILQHPGEKFDVAPFLFTDAVRLLLKKYKLLLMVPFQKNKPLNSDSALITLMN